ncbi:MAG: hypothetical protein ACPH27_03530 [Pseudomonadales bacterium]|jgi:hypothetical protein
MMPLVSRKPDGWVLLLSLIMILVLTWPLLSLIQQTKLQIDLQTESHEALQAHLEVKPLLSKGGLFGAESTHNNP